MKLFSWDRTEKNPGYVSGSNMYKMFGEKKFVLFGTENVGILQRRYLSWSHKIGNKKQMTGYVGVLEAKWCHWIPYTEKKRKKKNNKKQIKKWTIKKRLK